MATNQPSTETQPRKPQQFDYQPPGSFKTGKAIINLGNAPHLRGTVQVVKKGAGDNNLHIHTGMDGFYMVLKGEVTFYGPDDEVIGIYGENQGLTMPHGNAYWFANTGDKDLEILQVVAWAPGIDDKRIDVNPPKGDVAPEKSEKFDARIR